MTINTLLKENMRTISALLKRETQASIYINDIPYGEYTKDHITYFVSLLCPHLKGILHFDPQLEQYVCPVHGSRFNYDGKVLHSPAVNSLDVLSGMPESSDR